MKKRLCATGAVLGVLATLGALPAQASPQPQPQPQPHPHPPSSRPALPLGPAGLPESRTTTTLQPGVTLTRIVRGNAADPALHWTVEVSIPGGDTSPDPDAPPTALKDRASADELTAELRQDGFEARAEEVTTPATADHPGGTLGWRVRVGTFAAQSAATSERTRLRAAGHTGSAVYTGWDGEAADRGPWHVDVLTIDPRTFRGSLDASYGPNLENRETTSALSASAHATAAVNAGFFVLDPKAGAPGDPAGVGVYDGRLLSEPVAGRPGLVIQDNARGTEVTRLTWQGRVKGRTSSLHLNGVNRVPGLVRNCGGSKGDAPTSLPLHDVTCTNPDELVTFTPDYGRHTPQGAGLEAVLDAHDRVVELRSPRGGSLPPGGSSVQATGTRVADLTALARVGVRLRVSATLLDEHGHRVSPSPRTDILNAGPELVRDGRIHVTPATDGMVHPGDPSWYYGWVHKRNPRTLAGVDAAGRTVLVTADGRSTASLGLSIGESAEVAKSLGLHDAVNLDGGGSTTMVTDGTVINTPSDAAGERPVGEALLILPRAHHQRPAPATH
ncbi:phosphodiester glycosidase family protein [Streptomyces lancefieldiae]|uniref:Phosphodiester glycosidase family protein n=1 Tax=Streptomyces lancefieldiae TaxID=3075520 RepID=A0ABU3AEN8_9ACTN|nr:phosphodiester glycosidase family protein [Streptomyces sp. DSM 40712]MDT0608649.1 phosphodiester glycosidase family protein [Streptomyces sp. DSM 40712]